MSATAENAKNGPNERATVASAAEPVQAAAAEAADAVDEAVEQAHGRLTPRRVGVGAAAVIGFGAGALAAGMMLARRDGELSLRPGETIEVSARPRKGFWRYVGTLGLWELDRRATQYTLTNQRLVVERGLLHRDVSAIPVQDVNRVSVRTGALEGRVSVSTAGAGGPQRSQIGPLTASAARAFGRALAGAGARVEELAE